MSIGPDTLQSFIEKAHHDHTAKYLQTIVGVKSKVLGSGLYRGTYKLVAKSQGAEYIGAGDSSVLRYAAELLVRPLMSVDEANVIASYLIRLANRYTDGCSGGPDITIIRSDTSIVVEGTGGAFVDEGPRFAYCEAQCGKVMRELLISGGTMEALTRSVSQKSEPEQ